jgi:DNA-binding transcriptional regulator YiaG
VASARRGPPLECDLVTIEEASRLRDPPLLNLPGRPIQHIRGGALAQTWLEGRLPSIHWLASAAHVLSFRLATAAPEPEMVKTRLLMATVLGRMARERAAHPETLGERLLSLRKLAGYTQVDLAYRTRVSLTALRDWEHGRATPRPAHVAALCRVLKCRRGDLLG